MNRKQLLEILATVRPALTGISLIQSLTHLLFVGGTVTAFNDRIGISTRCEVDFTGTVPGATLISLLSASRAKDVEFTPGDDEIVVKAAGARMRLPLLPVDSFLFAMPETSDGDVLPITSKEFVEGVRSCLRSVSPDTSVPDQLGVTLIPKKKSIEMYSINGASMSHVVVPLSGACPLKRRVVLSAPFCEQLVRLAGGSDKKVRLVVSDDFALLTTSSGTRLFGKLVDVPKPLDFENQFASIVPADFSATATAVPATIKLALERALVVADPAGERVYTQVQVKDGVATMVTKSGRGEVRDRFKLGTHPDVEVSVDAQWLKVGCASFDKILVTDGAVIMSRGGELYLVATSG